MLKQYIDDMLTAWNGACKNSGIDSVYSLDTKCRVKKFYTTKEKFYELDIAELRFLHQGESNLLLWRKELQMPKIIKNVQRYKVEQTMTEELYKFFLYECIGTFSQTTQQLIISKDYAEYDIEKDRIKPNPDYDGYIVKCNKGGEFYEADDSFDVFQKAEGGWLVYTAHDIGKRTNGIAKIVDRDCEAINAKIILLNNDIIKPKRKKIIT